MAQVVNGQDDIAAVLAERGNRYGKFADHARISQTLKNIILERVAERVVLLEPDQEEAIAMICHKLARIANGDPDYADSWVDIAGYAKLVADRLNGVSR